MQQFRITFYAEKSRTKWITTTFSWFFRFLPVVTRETFKRMAIMTKKKKRFSSLIAIATTYSHAVDIPYAHIILMALQSIYGTGMNINIQIHTHTWYIYYNYYLLVFLLHLLIKGKTYQFMVYLYIEIRIRIYAMHQ